MSVERSAPGGATNTRTPVPSPSEKESAPSGKPAAKDLVEIKPDSYEQVGERKLRVSYLVGSGSARVCQREVKETKTRVMVIVKFCRGAQNDAPTIGETISVEINLAAPLDRRELVDGRGRPILDFPRPTVSPTAS